jgi:hypothetical protein
VKRAALVLALAYVGVGFYSLQQSWPVNLAWGVLTDLILVALVGVLATLRLQRQPDPIPWCHVLGCSGMEGHLGPHLFLDEEDLVP